MPSVPFTAQAVAAEALLAHAYGLLTAQSPRESDRDCVYWLACPDTERRCAIGWALTQEEAVEYATIGSVNMLCDALRPRQSIHSSDELMKLQRLHDEWADCWYEEGYDATLCEADFLALAQRLAGDANPLR